MQKPAQTNLETQNNPEAGGETNIKRFPRELIFLCVFLLMTVALAAGYSYWMMAHAPMNSNKNLHILDRSEWQGEPPSSKPEHLKLPISNVIISHTATEGCETEEICIYRMQTIQGFHMKSLGWLDIGYNFLVGGDGQIYVGRGWHHQGQHVRGYNAVSISIAFIGTFVNVEPPVRQVEAAKRLMTEGVRLHKLHPDYHIFAHRQLSPTESPGQRLFELIKHWPRWTQDVTELRLLGNATLKFVTRAYWLAQPAGRALPSLQLPVESVRFESTVSPACSTQAECVFRVRLLQTFHIESSGYTDINYNFVIAGDTNIYEGRGWDQSCESEQDHNATTNELVVGFVGATASNKKLALELIQQGIKWGHISKNYTLTDNAT
ncbi:peptidoglycan-recognition protein LF [Drosophila guanche]|uniref:Blast:Peptidoglycan-recognition protein LF n=1 Tax=Drosophila guanche TaxID=7266 RepID=A0A3B0KGE2_DROGU|nr:peptidoglycan-recognition protein LF [Drosophila guanche]SPP85409.1 blast:Peptidoglycan-recognition protein LF [Drosophila guanche]